VIKRKKKSKRTSIEIQKMEKPYKHSMEHNTGYSMDGKDFQDMYTHAIPKRVSKETRAEKRISMKMGYLLFIYFNGISFV
jgi:hypothetical protein